MVPDGVAGFFVSYECLEKYVESWMLHGTIDKIQQYKLLFIETQARRHAARLRSQHSSRMPARRPLH